MGKGLLRINHVNELLQYADVNVYIPFLILLLYYIIESILILLETQRCSF